jgi:hypothetical protein
MRIGDLVTLVEHPNNGGIGVIVEINDYETWNGSNGRFYWVQWGNDPHSGQLAVEDWVYFEKDLKIARNENG